MDSWHGEKITTSPRGNASAPLRGAFGEWEAAESGPFSLERTAERWAFVPTRSVGTRVLICADG
jgi:hypothetical protein